MAIVRLPLCPSTNGLFVNAGKRRILSKPYKAWRTEAGYALNLHRIQPFGKLKIELEISVCEAMQGDASNRIKAVEDLIVDHGIIDDDRQVWRVSIEKVSPAICPSKEMLLSIMPFTETRRA